MHPSVDVGGTFTDLVVEDGGKLQSFKAPTTPDDPIIGMLEVLHRAAVHHSSTREQLLSRCQLFIHATTRATNAVLTVTTCKTAFLTTSGHPDILTFREGGRIRPFDNTVAFPKPYVPRHLTFEVTERIRANGNIITPLDVAGVVAITQQLRQIGIEAVAVCLLWSIVNPAHEDRIGELLEQYLPGIAYSLSNRLNPSVREYRRASSTCIDASLKPLMSEYLASLESRLRTAGFTGRLVNVTSQASMMDVAELAQTPIHSINCGPAMAPLAGRYYAMSNDQPNTAIVADTGGTSFDVSLVRGGVIPWTHETWLGERLRGHMTGFPSVDVRSVGAGGGSIAWVDEGGMLHVGPASAGSKPGPACYGLGATQATVTDAAVVLGFIDADNFLGGDMRLNVRAAEHAIMQSVGNVLDLSLDSAANAIFDVMTQNMTHAIEGITIDQGIDPREAILIAGGGAAGLNSVQIARRLGCKTVIVPSLGATLSAVGAQLSELVGEFSSTCVTSSESFDFAAVNKTLAQLSERSNDFIEKFGGNALRHRTEFSFEARYPHQVWEIEVPLHTSTINKDDEVHTLVNDFHRAHKAMFFIEDRRAGIEILIWRAKAHCTLVEPTKFHVATPNGRTEQDGTRLVHFAEVGPVNASVRDFAGMACDEQISGPAIVESNLTTVVLDPNSHAKRTVNGDLLITVSIENHESR